MLKAIAALSLMLLMAACGTGTAQAPVPNSDSKALMTEAVSLRDRLARADAALLPSTSGDTVSGDGLVVRAGLDLLGLVEVIRQNYLNGLNESNLIGYLNQAGGDKRFDEYWKLVSDQWFHERIPACRAFANWEQFKEDRLWVQCAAEYLADPESYSDLKDDGWKLFGESWFELQELKPGAVLQEAKSPRRVNVAMMERYRHRFPKLFQKYRLSPDTETFSKLRSNSFEETDSSLINHPTGLRKKLFRAYHADVVAQLDKAIAGNESLVSFIIVRVPSNTLPGFDAADLNLISPTPTGAKLEVTSSIRSTRSGEVTLDRGATVHGKRAYGFTKELDSQSDVRLFLDYSKVVKLLLPAFGVEDPATEVKALNDKISALDAEAREEFGPILAEIDQLVSRLLE
ncbi:MAG: hypothetical protein H6841_08990 [Planctomycetes bacterium]|nr:hypothetical protein [Planctomycetota bacterium]MCB9936110.1 hypothetical protein [Planctomycetota bacterium]